MPAAPILRDSYIFNRGWDKRGSGVGEPIRPQDMQNAWMVEDERGSIESMPGDAVAIDWSAHTTRFGLLAVASGVRQGEMAVSDGNAEDIEDGAIHILGVTPYGEVLTNVYDTSGITNVSLNSEHSGDEECFPGIAKLGNKFHIFMGQDNDTRKGQVVPIGSTTQIADISISRPTVSSCTIAADGGTYTEVKGTVRYWVAEVKGTKESALSPQIPRVAPITNYLHFDASNTEYTTGPGANFDKASDWSAEFMFRKGATPAAAQCIWSKRADLASGTAGWSIHVASTGAIHFEVSDDTAEETVNTTMDLCDGEWHRITCTYDQSDGDMHIYVDGTLDATNSSASWANATTNLTSASIGSAGSASNFFTGDVTDFRMYSATEVTDPDADGDMFGAVETPGSKTGLTGYWPCNEGSGTTLNDGVGSDDAAFSQAPDWKDADEALAAAEIDLGDGDRVTITFDSSLYGKKLRIYRSQANGAQPYYLATFKPTSGDPDYQDAITDANLGDLPFLHGDQPPAKARACVAHANRMFVAVGNKLYWTDITNDESYWTADNGNWTPVAPDDGDVITALASDYDSVIIFKSNHIYRMTGRKPDEFSIRPIVPGSAVPVSVGAPNINAVCTTPLGIAFYWNRKVFILSGNSLTRISDPISEELNSDNLDLIFDNSGTNENTEWYSANLGYYAQRNQLWFCIGHDEEYPNRTFIYDLSTQEWVGKRENGYVTPQSIRGMNIWRDDFPEELFFGASPKFEGRVMQIVKDTSKTFWASLSPQAYTSSVTLSPFYGNSLNNRKRFKYVDIEFEVQSGNTETDVIWWLDGDPSAATTVPVETDATALGVPSTQTRVIKRVNINDAGHSLTVKFSGVPNSDGHWKVHSITYGYQDLGSLSR